jgi:large subunit ribosomal protein L31
MKEKIHPKYYRAAAKCACGATYDIGSTKDNIRVDICSACHPFFTGKSKSMERRGRVERFKKKYAEKAIVAKKPAKKKPAKKKA